MPFIYFLAVIVSTIFCTRTAVEGFIGFYIYNDSMIFTYVMLIGFVPGIILSGFCGKLADKFGKRNLLAFIFVLITAASLIIYFIGRDNKLLFIVIGGLCAIPNALIAVVSKLPATTFNAVVAIIFAPILAVAIRKALEKNRLTLD